MRSGWLYPSILTGVFRHAGAGSVWWSAGGTDTRADGTAGPSAYDLYIYLNTINPSHYNSDRYAAFPLRCLSTVLGM